MRPHEFRELVNELRDTAVKFHDHQSLRERVVHVLWAHEVFPDAQPTPSVPDGWKLVPIEPTTEIRKAMHYAYWQSQSPQLPYHDGSPELWNAAYAAMLEAAPEAKP